MVDIDATVDYYACLNVPVDADEDDIRSAYRTAARRYHPDRSTGDEARFRLIQQAYEVIGDKVYRQAYDRQRQSRGFQAQSVVIMTVQQNAAELEPLDAEQMLYAMVTLQPNQSSPQTRRPLNLALVIDRSTSMMGTRMRQVQIAANDMLDLLRPDDFISLITYSDRADVVAPAMPASNTIALKSAIASIAPSGGTEIFQGLAAGVSQIHKNYSKNTINHIILMTDGRTYGDEEQALSAAKQLGERGIGVTAFGIGEDWNDRFLDELARHTGQNALYISNPTMVRDVLRELVREMANLVVKNARLTINHAPYVKIRKVFRAAPHMQTVNLDDDESAFVGGVSITEPTIFAIEFLITQPELGDYRIARIGLSADDLHLAAPLSLHRDIQVHFTMNPVVRPPSAKMLNVLTRLSVYQLQENAWRAYETGDTVTATKMLQSAATRLFDLGFDHLGKAAMLEVGRLVKGNEPTERGRKEIRYGTRALELPGI